MRPWLGLGHDPCWRGQQVDLNRTRYRPSLRKLNIMEKYIMATNSKPLEGLTIVEISAFIAAPYAGLHLAQLGAEVIRIDPIGGGLDFNRWPITKDGRSLYWSSLNMGKKSLSLNMKDPKAQDIVRDLLAQKGQGQGMVITNLGARGWMSYEALCAVRPDLIMVQILGNRDGSVALDYTVNARVGYPWLTGPAEANDQPVNHVMPMWDVVTGMLAANALLVALRNRESNGQGQLIKIPLADAAMSVVSNLGLMAEVMVNDEERPRLGNHVYGTFGCNFATADGRQVMITAFTPRHWTALVAATQTEEQMQALAASHGVDLKKEENRYLLRDDIEKILQPWFAQRSLEAIGALLDEHQACWGPYQTVRQLVDEDPYASLENPMFQLVDQPHIGSYRVAGSPLDFSKHQRVAPTASPTLGGDNKDILINRLGVSEDDFHALVAEGVVGAVAE